MLKVNGSKKLSIVGRRFPTSKKLSVAAGRSFLTEYKGGDAWSAGDGRFGEDVGGGFGEISDGGGFGVLVKVFECRGE